MHDLKRGRCGSLIICKSQIDTFNANQSCTAVSHSHWQRDPLLGPYHLYHIQADEDPEQKKAGAAHVGEQDPPVSLHLQVSL